MNKNTKKNTYTFIYFFISSSSIFKTLLRTEYKKKYLQNTITIYTYIYLKTLYISTLKLDDHNK